MHTYLFRSMFVFVGVLAIVTSIACEAARSPAAPTEPAVATSADAEQPASAAARAPDAPMTGVIPVAVARGSLDIASRYDATLNIGSRDPARFSWKGQLSDGWSPFDRIDVGVPGRPVSIDAMWVGLSLDHTSLTWGKTTYTRIGG